MLASPLATPLTSRLEAAETIINDSAIEAQFRQTLGDFLDAFIADAGNAINDENLEPLRDKYGGICNAYLNKFQRSFLRLPPEEQKRLFFMDGRPKQGYKPATARRYDIVEEITQSVPIRIEVNDEGETTFVTSTDFGPEIDDSYLLRIYYSVPGGSVREVACERRGASVGFEKEIWYCMSGTPRQRARFREATARALASRQRQIEQSREQQRASPTTTTEEPQDTREQRQSDEESETGLVPMRTPVKYLDHEYVVAEAGVFLDRDYGNNYPACLVGIRNPSGTMECDYSIAVSLCTGDRPPFDSRATFEGIGADRMRIWRLLNGEGSTTTEASINPVDWTWRWVPFPGKSSGSYVLNLGGSRGTGKRSIVLGQFYEKGSREPIENMVLNP